MNPDNFRATMIRAVLEDTWSEAELAHALLIVRRLAGGMGEALVAPEGAPLPNLSPLLPMHRAQQERMAQVLEELGKKDKERVTPPQPKKAKLTPEQALERQRKRKAEYQAKLRAAAPVLERRTCQHCGGAFESADPRKRFCSKKCGGAANRASKDPEQRRAKYRKYNATYRAKKAASKAVQGQPEQPSKEPAAPPTPQPPLFRPS